MEASEDAATNRQAFEIEDQGDDKDKEGYITVDKPHVAFTFCNFLITSTCIALFCYVNSYFAIRLHKVVDGSIIRDDTATFSCNQYFCDRTLYNYMYFYSFYLQCNQLICSSAICSDYAPDCGNNQYYVDFNRYFACEPTCPNYIKSNYPNIMILAYGLSIAAAVCFALNLLVHIIMGIVFNIKSREINCKERIGLLLSFMWPSLKYFFLRQRNNWIDFDLNLRAMVTVDYVCGILLSFTMAIYIWFYVIGTWFQNKEIALFFMLLGSYINHWLLCWSNGRTFWKAKKRFS